jgi:hypothetical protein
MRRARGTLNPNQTQSAPEPRWPRQVTQLMQQLGAAWPGNSYDLTVRLGRNVALHYRSSTLYQIY